MHEVHLLAVVHCANTVSNSESLSILAHTELHVLRLRVYKITASTILYQRE